MRKCESARIAAVMTAMVCSMLCVLLVPSARADSAGKLDPHFGSGGLINLKTAVGGFTDYAPSIAQVPGGVLIQYEMMSEGLPRRFVSLVSPSGTVDPGFGSGGVAVGPSAWLVAYSTGPLGGSYFVDADPSPTDFRLQRMDRTGQPDPSFTPITETSNLRGPVAITYLSGPTDKLLLYRSDGLERRNADGSLDTSWGSGGLAPFSTRGMEFYSYPDGSQAGKVLVMNSVNGKKTLTRLNVDGRVDRSFGKGGTVILGNQDVVLPLESGGALLAGKKKLSLPSKGTLSVELPTLSRLDGRGRIDKGFGDGGSLVIDDLDPRKRGYAAAEPFHGGVVNTSIELQGGSVLIATRILKFKIDKEGYIQPIGGGRHPETFFKLTKNGQLADSYGGKGYWTPKVPGVKAPLTFGRMVETDEGIVVSTDLGGGDPALLGLQK